MVKSYCLLDAIWHRRLARRKMRWAVRRLAAMSPLERIWLPYRRKPRIVIQYTKLTPAEVEKADRIERFCHEALDRLNPAK